MFRSVDIHGNISNPSSIYEIEIINSEGTIFPIIKVVGFMEKDDKVPKYEAKRFIHIEPIVAQKTVNEIKSTYYNEDGSIKETADLVKNNVVLGLTEQTIWNKKFRLKIRSKSTGKLVEVDFKFVHKLQQEGFICK
jgi:hypothetical protein